MAEPCTPKFLQFVAAVANSTSFPYPNLKPYFIAQCILECGRGTTKLFSDYSNPYGMHYHPWMSSYAKGVEYDACDGKAIYASFAVWEDVIHGYFNWFRTWSHYAGWESHTADGLDFLSFIGKSYCPPGFTQSWIDQHGGVNYAQYIVQKLLPEAKALLAAVPVDPIPVSDKDDTITGFALNASDDLVPYIIAYSDTKAKYLHKITTRDDLIKWFSHFPNAQPINQQDIAKVAMPKVLDFGEKKPDPKPEPVTHKYVPFSKQTNSIMPIRATVDPKYLIWHWTCGSPDATGEDTISWGKSQGYTYAALDDEGQLWQSVPTNAGGYHTGEGIVSSTECYGVEVICAGKVEKINGLYVPWFAKKSDGSIDKARCIPESQINYDPDNFDDDHSFTGYYHAFTTKQIATILKTCLYFMEQYKMPIDSIRDHAEVAKPFGRKTDIGYSYKGGIEQLRKDVQKLWDSGKRWTDL